MNIFVHGGLLYCEGTMSSLFFKMLLKRYFRLFSYKRGNFSCFFFHFMHGGIRVVPLYVADANEKKNRAGGVRSEVPLLLKGLSLIPSTTK